MVLSLSHGVFVGGFLSRRFVCDPFELMQDLIWLLRGRTLKETCIELIAIATILPYTIFTANEIRAGTARKELGRVSKKALALASSWLDVVTAPGLIISGVFIQFKLHWIEWSHR